MNAPTGPITAIELAALVDRLAELKAMIEPLQKQEEIIKDALKATGRDRIDGTKHTAVISISEPEILDRERLKADLGADIWKSYLKPSKISLTCRLTGRKTH